MKENKETIIKKLNVLLADKFEINIKDITPEASLKDILELDSLNGVDLLALCQQHFKVFVPVEDIDKFITFKDLYDYIELKTQK